MKTSRADKECNNNPKRFREKKPTDIQRVWNLAHIQQELAARRQLDNDLLQWLLDGLFVLEKNYANGEQKEPFPVAVQKTKFTKMQFVYELSEVLTQEGIEELAANTEILPSGLNTRKIGRYRSEMKKAAKNSSNGWAVMFERHIGQMRDAIERKGVYSAIYTSGYVDAIDFSDERIRQYIKE